MAIILHKQFEFSRAHLLHFSDDFKRLVNTINAIPGIEIVGTLFSQEGLQERYKPIILFTIPKNDESGLFFLTRCTDRRYWQYGHYWTISLFVGDVMHSDGARPITYELSMNDYISDSSNQINSLIDNMNDHIHHKNFMAAFNLDIDKFSIIDTVVENRVNSINTIFSAK